VIKNLTSTAYSEHHKHQRILCLLPRKPVLLRATFFENYRPHKYLMAEKERLSFEEALKKLESIVEQLEDEEITLEDSVKLYEEGVRMSKFCTEILEKAELRIEQVNDEAKSQ